MDIRGIDCTILAFHLMMVMMMSLMQILVILISVVVGRPLVWVFLVVMVAILVPRMRGLVP